MKIKKIVTAAFIVFFAPNALAAEIIAPAEVLQGSTIIIEVPGEDFTSVSGSLDGHDLKFYKITRKPAETESITRAEFLELMFLNNDFGETGVPRLAHAEDRQPFPDVAVESPYYEYISRAKNLGIISGYEDGYFRPHALITRGQAAKMLVEAFKPPPAPSTATPFPDVPAGHVFQGYIADSVSSGWFKGYPDGLMRPDRNINFLEAGIVIRRAAIPEKFADNGEKEYFRAYAGVHRTTAPGIKQITITASTDPTHTDIPESTYTATTDIPESDFIATTFAPTAESSDPEEPSTLTFAPPPPPKILTKEITVTKRPVRVVRFSLSKEKTDLFGDDAQTKTWAAVDAARLNPATEQLWDGAFIRPTTGEITLGFGDVLYINGAYSGSHFGIDYVNNAGTPIRAANAGRVTLAEYTPAFGNTVVIDHGRNVFTMYLHMSELKTVKDAVVQKGDEIGLMGTTGISSGDHLHYTMFIGDVIVDSDPWM